MKSLTKKCKRQAGLIYKNTHIPVFDGWWDDQFPDMPCEEQPEINDLAPVIEAAL